MRIMRQAVVWTQTGTPRWLVDQMAADFLLDARNVLPRGWSPIPATECLAVRRVPEGYRLVYSVEVER